MTRDELDALATEVYGGPKWASALAADLTWSGRTTQAATVNHWQSGERPVATWAPAALVVAWHARSLRLREAAYRSRSVADRLSAALVPDAEPDEDLNLGPRM